MNTRRGRYYFHWDEKSQKGTWYTEEEWKGQAPKQDVHYVLQDTMEPIESMATPYGEMFDSRSAYKAHLKAHGYEETGKDHLTRKPPPPYKPDFREIRETIEKTYYDIRENRVPISERERALCQQEERNYQAYLRRNR